MKPAIFAIWKLPSHQLCSQTFLVYKIFHSCWLVIHTALPGHNKLKLLTNDSIMEHSAPCNRLSSSQGTQGHLVIIVVADSLEPLGK